MAFSPLMRNLIKQNGGAERWAGSAWASAPKPAAPVQSSPKTPPWEIPAAAPAAILTVAASEPAIIAAPSAAPQPPAPAPFFAPAARAPDTGDAIRTLLDQGASQQQAFTGALNSLLARGVPVTPAVQASVAEEVKNAGNGIGQIGIIVAGLAIFALFAFSGRKSRARRWAPRDTRR